MSNRLRFASMALLLIAPIFGLAQPQQPVAQANTCPEPFSRHFEMTEAISVAAEKAFTACTAMQQLLSSASQNWESLNNNITDILTDRVSLPARRIDSTALLYVEAARDLPAAENRFRESSILADNLFWDRRVYLRKHGKDFEKPLLEAYAAWESKTMAMLKTHALDPQVFDRVVKKSSDMWDSEMQERESVINRARENLNELVSQYNRQQFPPQHDALPVQDASAGGGAGTEPAGKGH